MNTAHLDEEQLAQSLSGSSDLLLKQHLAECGVCRDEHARLLAAIAQMRDYADSAAQQPEWFWTRQRAEAAARLQAGRRGWFAAPAMAAACGLIVLSVLLLVGGKAPQAPAAAAADPDDTVMRQVESHLSQPMPDALAPAAYLSEDLAQAAARAESGRN